MGGRRGRLTSLEKRKSIVALIEETISSGARQSLACDICEISPRTYQRWIKTGVTCDGRLTARRVPPANKLSELERQKILQVCNAEAYSHLSPSQIVPILLDKGRYIASESSFYRVLRAANQLSHRGRAKAKTRNNKLGSFTATQANQVWSWDITYCPSRVIGQHYYLYMIEDIYSRKIVGWEVYDNENGEDASRLLERSVWAENCVKNRLVLHSDNGAPMKSYTMRAKMYELGVASSYSRPRVSNDNAYSESLFRTVKYHPRWPSEGFMDIDSARIWTKQFVQWYNNEHRHSRIKFVTPAQRHEGKDIEILHRRDLLYVKMKRRTPSRWSTTTRNWQHEPIVKLNPKENQKVA